MATFSSTTFKSPRDIWGTHKVQFVTLTGPVSYTTNGDPINANDAFGVGNIDALIPCGVAWSDSADAVRLLVWDSANQKMLWFVPNTGAEVANAVDLSSYSVTVLVVG